MRAVPGLRVLSVFALMVSILVAIPTSTVAQSDNGQGNSGNRGNSANAHACKQGGHVNWLTAEGNAFLGTDDCVSYAAEGGTLTSVAYAACLGGDHASMAPSVAYAMAFTSEATFRAHIDAGGEVVAWQRGSAWAYTDMYFHVSNNRLTGCTATAIVEVRGYNHVLVTYTGLFASSTSEYSMPVYNGTVQSWPVYLWPGTGGGSTTVTVQGVWFDWATGTEHYGDVLISNWALNSYCPYS